MISSKLRRIIDEQLINSSLKKTNNDYAFSNENINDWLRHQRNNLLKECDWTQTVDAPLSAEKKAEWATYRQQLRDFLQTHNESTINSWADFDSIVWPTKPE